MQGSNVSFPWIGVLGRALICFETKQRSRLAPTNSQCDARSCGHAELQVTWQFHTCWPRLHGVVSPKLEANLRRIVIESNPERNHSYFTLLNGRFPADFDPNSTLYEVQFRSNFYVNISNN